MTFLDKIKESIESAKTLELKYQSGYTTGTRDWYECPCCGNTVVQYDEKLSMNDVAHDYHCLYRLMMNLDTTIRNDESLGLLLNSIEMSDEDN